MKHDWKLFAVAAAITWLGGACSGKTGNSNKSEGAVGTSGSNGANGPTMTVTGCVEPGDPAGTYVLTNAKSEMTSGASGSGGSSGASGTSGTSGTVGPNSAGGSRASGGGKTTAGGGADTLGNDRAFAGRGERYRLISEANVDFGQHVRQQVRVTGQVASLPDSSAPAGTTGGKVAPPDHPPAGTTGGTGNPTAGTSGNAQGNGGVGAGLESRSNQGSGGGRVLGGSSDRAVAQQFLRVTSLTKVADNCGGK